jgi:hypothetical protein
MGLVGALGRQSKKAIAKSGLDPSAQMPYLAASPMRTRASSTLRAGGKNRIGRACIGSIGRGCEAVSFVFAGRRS